MQKRSANNTEKEWFAAIGVKNSNATLTPKKTVIAFRAPTRSQNNEAGICDIE